MNGEPSAARRATPTINFRRLDGKIPKGKFACGEKEIDRWSADAFKHHDQLKTRVWAGYLSGNNTPTSLYGLRIRLEADSDIEGNDGIFQSESKHFAAVQLSYLGVQRPMQRSGIGELTMLHAIKQFGLVADQTGICAMTLVAINGEKASWYEKLGFRRYGRPCLQPKMFFPARSAIEMIQQGEAVAEVVASNDTEPPGPLTRAFLRKVGALATKK